ncbi:MAG: hypothetical protein ACLP9L_38820 [Thermoguttaceae bacterium]
MTDPKREKPESDHPHEDDLSLDFQQLQEGIPAAGDGSPLEDLSSSASTEEFHFSGPAEELDFTEPADFTFPTELPGEVASEHSGELAGAEPAEAQGLVKTEGGALGELPPPEEGAVEPELAGEGIPEVEAADTEEKTKRKIELPAWVQTAEWVMVGVLTVGALLSIIVSVFWVASPKTVTIVLNIACPLILLLIPYALWRSSARWVTPPASAIYTLMLAMSTAALVAGMWCEGLELSRYDWLFSKARVTAAKPRPVVIAAPAPPTVARAVEPAPAPAPAPGTAKGKAAPAAAKK